MLDVLVEHQAGLPRRRPPLRGQTSDALECRPVVTAPLAPRQTTDGTASRVADRARYNAAQLPPLAHTRRAWSTRVPAPVSDAQAALAEADPATMAPLMAGDGAPVRAATDAGVTPRGARIDSERRRPQALRTGATSRLQQRAAAVKAFQT